MARKPKVEVFKATNKEFCWRCIATNGKELFRASETYKNKDRMIEILHRYLGSRGLLFAVPHSPDNWKLVDLTEKP